MKKVFLLLLSTFLIVACQSTKKEKVENETSDKVIIDIPETKVSETNSTKTTKTSEVIEEEIEEFNETQPEINEVKEIIVSEEITDEGTTEVEETIKDVSTTEEPSEEINETQPEINEPEIVKNFDHSPWSTFLNKYVSLNGNVNYKAIKANQTELNTYLNQFAKTSPNLTWTKNEKLAYWINAYNAFTIKLIIDNYPLKSIKDIRKPWDKKFIPINEKLMNLTEIEHEILRKMNEPRIHFAINCASVSCPKLLNTAFLPETLNSQLDTAAKRYINSKENSIEKGNVKLSKIFKWFNKDFETNGSVINFINQYAKTKVSSNEKIGYLDYNWSLND